MVIVQNGKINFGVFIYECENVTAVKHLYTPIKVTKVIMLANSKGRKEYYYNQLISKGKPLGHTVPKSTKTLYTEYKYCKR